MKKLLFIGIITLIVGSIIAVDRLQSAVQGNLNDPNMAPQRQSLEAREGYMMSPKGKMMRACPMHGMMMSNLMIPSMIATEDGDIIIMAAGKLLKYDQHLNLIKEVEIKFDIDSMCQRMSLVMEKCRLCQKMNESNQPPPKMKK